MNPWGYSFCPRCGGALEDRVVKSGEPERLVCAECGFVFYQGPKLAASAIFELDGGIVLTQRAIEPGYGMWTFPGGFVELGERAETAAERESLEECGVELEVEEIIGLYSYTHPAPAIVVYSATVVGGEPKARDETLAVDSFARDKLPWAELAFPSTGHALKDYLKR